MSKIYMTRCPKCNTENYAFCVADGVCCWCNYKATEKDIDGVRVWKEMK
jgi:hypothetical protein